MSLQFLKGTSDQLQLFYENHLYYQTRPNYWACKDNFCSVTLKTAKNEENELVVAKAPNFRHNDNQINNDDYLCRKAIKEIKDRILKEVDTLPRAIFDQEIRRLQTEHKMDPATISILIKPYAYYQNTFQKKRAKVRPKSEKTTTIELPATSDSTTSPIQDCESKLLMINPKKRKNRFSFISKVAEESSGSETEESEKRGYKKMLL